MQRPDQRGFGPIATLFFGAERERGNRTNNDFRSRNPIERSRLEMQAVGVTAKRYRIVLIPLWIILLAIPGCAARPRDDGYAFLARYRDQWQRTAPGHVMPVPITSSPTSAQTTPLPGATPAPTTTPRALPTLVYLDPGHGGIDTGTIGTAYDGTSVYEKNIALALALRTADHLRQVGIGVVLSRTDDSLPGVSPADYTSDGKMLTPDGVLADLQRRIDRANSSGARVLLSIHLNGFSDQTIGGAETFYDSSRSFGDSNKKFATLIQNNLIATLRAHDYDTPDRGVTDDQELQIESLGSLVGNYNHLVLLGPAVPGRLRPSMMPGALSEPLFLSNPPEATAVLDPAFQDLIASSYAKAIEEFLDWKPESATR